MPNAKFLLPVVALATLSACAPTFEARVARFSQLPPPEARSFVIEPRDRADAGLEFATYANDVRRNLLAHGFVEAADPSQAALTVQLDWQVGPPREQIRSRPSAWGGWGAPGWGPGWGWGPYWGAGWGGWGGAGWGGWGGAWGGTEVYSVTQYNSILAMKMFRNADKKSVFEGRAETVSTSNNLTRLVPNLVTAMFAEFPGNSGQTVRVRFNPNDPSRPANVRPLG